MDRGLLSDLAGGGDCQSDDVRDESRMGREGGSRIYKYLAGCDKLALGVMAKAEDVIVVLLVCDGHGGCEGWV